MTLRESTEIKSIIALLDAFPLCLERFLSESNQLVDLIFRRWLYYDFWRLGQLSFILARKLEKAQTWGSRVFLQVDI